MKKHQQTHEYFDKFTPHYNPKRFNFALEYLNEVATDHQNILDIGCGDGATLHLIKKHTALKILFGLDMSGNYLRKAKELVDCYTIEGSILDDTILEEYRGRFNYCILGAVIHHLIGKNRKESFQYAQTCLMNAIDLLKPCGSLIIFEPTYGPSMLMGLVFWIKKIIGSLTNKRVELSMPWMNIGQPVISYCTPKQLLSLSEGIAGTKIVTSKEIDKSRLGIVIYRVGMRYGDHRQENGLTTASNQTHIPLRFMFADYTERYLTFRHKQRIGPTGYLSRVQTEINVPLHQ
jgi:SAM-dependent methyltransferase